MGTDGDTWGKRIGDVVAKLIPDIKAQLAEQLQFTYKPNIIINVNVGDSVVSAKLPSLQQSSTHAQNQISAEFDEKIKENTLKDLESEYPNLSQLPENKRVQIIAQTTANNTAAAFSSFIKKL